MTFTKSSRTSEKLRLNDENTTRSSDSARATADVGDAIGAGTDVAVESAGIGLVRSDPREVARAIELSCYASEDGAKPVVGDRYNLIAFPVAAGIVVRWKVDLPMSVGRTGREPIHNWGGPATSTS